MIIFSLKGVSDNILWKAGREIINDIDKPV
jgi:hypothetical protein